MVDIISTENITVKNSTFSHRLIENLEKFPTQTISFSDGKAVDFQKLTYQELNQRIYDSTLYLKNQKLTGKTAILLFEPGLDFVIAFCACLCAGVIAVPIQPPRRNRNSDYFLSIAKDANSTDCIISHSRFILSGIDLNQSEYPLRFHNISKAYSARNAEWNEIKISVNEVAFLQYTSGSTNRPKGVIISHKNLLSNLDFIAKKTQQSQRSIGVIWLPNYHDMGLIGGILLPLYLGFPVTLMSPMTFLKSPFKWLRMISDLKATTSAAPNFAFDLCVKRIKEEQLAELDLRPWEVAFVGAEPICPATLNAFYNKFSQCGFRKETFYPCYGMAESTLMITGGKVDNPPVVVSIDKSALKQKIFKPITSNAFNSNISKEIVGCGNIPKDGSVRIVCPVSSRSCKEKEIGEIQISGSSVSCGYWGEIFQDPPSNNKTSFFRTGDLGCIYNDELFVTGRFKELIIIDGQNHYPQDIERSIQKCHCSIRENRQVAFSISGDLTEKLCIIVEVERRTEIEIFPEIITAIRNSVVENHELSPAIIMILESGTIPITTSGKLRRLECQRLFQERQLRPLFQTGTSITRYEC